MSTRYLNLAMERSPVGMGIRKVDQWVDYSDFTDGGSTAGTLNLTKQIPAGSFVIGSKVTVKTGFAGDTTCVLDIGNSGDADAYSYTTHDIFSAASNLVEGADSSTGGNTGCGLVPVSTATTVLLTATSGSDWGAVTAGKMYVEVFYFSTNPEITENYANKLGETI